MSYPIDFYATNLYTAITSYVQTKLSTWNCPPILTPDKYLTTASLAAFNLAHHVNLNLYSKAPLPGGGGKNIYPPTAGTFDRSTFYLAKKSTGVFSVPVNAYIAPGVITATPDPTASDTPSTIPPPLGYGVRPIPVGANGSGQETCPGSSVPIPAKHHWVKVWLFRASLSQRHFVTSDDLKKIQSISCNPGDWTAASGQGIDATSLEPIFSGCPLTIANNNNALDKANPGGHRSVSTAPGSSLSFNEVGKTAPFPGSTVVGVPATTKDIRLADRVLGGSAQHCVRLQTYNQDPCSGVTGAYPGAACSFDSNYDDIWQVIIPDISRYAKSKFAGCSYSLSTDPLVICPSVNTPAHPTSYHLNTVDYDLTAYQPNARYDYLFVVTPPSVTTASMLDSSASSASLPYQPYRFYSNQDCLSADPDAAASGDCLPSNAIKNYGLKFHDVASNGDPPADDPTNTRGGEFPICALQPDL
jgi:hypothetical protein